MWVKCVGIASAHSMFPRLFNGARFLCYTSLVPPPSCLWAPLSCLPIFWREGTQMPQYNTHQECDWNLKKRISQKWEKITETCYLPNHQNCTHFFSLKFPVNSIHFWNSNIHWISWKFTMQFLKLKDSTGLSETLFFLTPGLESSSSLFFH